MKKKTANLNIKKTIFQGLINTTSRNEQPLWRRARYRAVERETPRSAAIRTALPGWAISRFGCGSRSSMR